MADSIRTILTSFIINGIAFFFNSKNCHLKTFQIRKILLIFEDCNGVAKLFFMRQMAVFDDFFLYRIEKSAYFHIYFFGEIFFLMISWSSATFTRICSMVSRSRTVTVLSSSV